MLPFLRINIALLLLIISSHTFNDQVDAEIEEHKLPSIWNQKDDGGASPTERSYRFVAEIQMLETGKFYLLEEWFSNTKQMFRFDLIESSTGKRQTILINKSTGEKFKYSPFKCSLIENYDGAFDPKLANKFPYLNNGTALVPLGIGSLWLYALKAPKYTYRPPNEESSLSVGENKIKRFAFVMKRYARFGIESTQEFPFAMTMYFRDHIKGGAESLSLIHIGKQNGNMVDVSIRIKIIEIELPWLPKESTTDANTNDVFELPIGYGCQRNEQFDHPFVDPIDILGSREIPHVLELRIVTSQPVNSVRHDSHRWRTNTLLVRLLSGRLSLNGEHQNDYAITEVQDFRPFFESPKLINAGGQVRRATLRRLKRVWDLGDKGELDESAKSKSKISGEGVTYFEIDEQSGKCVGYGESQPELSGLIELPFAGGPQVKSQSVNGSSSSSSEDDDEYVDLGPKPIQLAGLSFNEDLLKMLFSSSTGYHLLGEKSSKLKRSTEYIYERRVNLFELTDKSGKPIWSGPISIIRRHSLSLSVVPLLFGLRHQTSVSMRFYSKDLDYFIGVIHLTVTKFQRISESYFHRELNVDACFAHLKSKYQIDEFERQQTKNSPALFNRKSMSVFGEDSGGGLDFTISYPVPTAEIGAKLPIYHNADDRFYKETLRTIDAALGGQLDLLQIVNIDINFGEEMIKISGKLLTRPSLLNYRREVGRKFDTNARKKLYYTEFKQDEESCAETCDQYNCKMFSYCQSSKMCDLVMSQNDNSPAKQDMNSIPFKADSSCCIFRLRESSSSSSSSNEGFKKDEQQQHHRAIEPHELIRKLRQKILNQKGDQEGPLTLRVIYYDDGNEQKLNLNPNSIESGEFLEEDFEDLIGEITPPPPITGDDDENLSLRKQEQEQQPNKQIVHPTTALEALTTGEQSKLVKAEYLLVFENRKFEFSLSNFGPKVFPMKQVNYMNYEECELLCKSVDCKSFSHCQIEQTCLISQLHDTESIEKTSTKEDFCFIMAQDYLSKFKRTIQVDKPTKSSKLINALTSRDCAVACMEEQNFKCRSFFYCPFEEGCHLRKSHLSTRGGEQQRQRQQQIGKEEINSNSSANQQQKCDLYSRSFLAEFDRFYGKALPDSDDESDDIVYQGLGAETCALECAHREGACQAFHVCLNDYKQVTCQLWLNKKLDQLGGRKNLDKLVANEKCTTFLVSLGSELEIKTKNMKLVVDDDDDDEEADGIKFDFESIHNSCEQQQQLAEEHHNSHWLLGSILLLFGAAMGYGIVTAFGLRNS